MKVFWSWQSDTPGKIGRHFVRDALNEAIEILREPQDIEEPSEREARESLHLDHDRKGVAGSPDLAPTIFKKIEQAVVFVADVTPIGFAGSGDGPEQKPLINSNVAIEYGYALRALGDEAILMVQNVHYGDRESLPFDLKHKAGPIQYRLSPTAAKREIDAERARLRGVLIEALRPYLAHPAGAVVMKFDETPSTGNIAFFWDPSEVLARIGTTAPTHLRHQSEEDDRIEFRFNEPRTFYLRLIPTQPLPDALSVAALSDVVQRRRLQILTRTIGGGTPDRNRFGAITFEPHGTATVPLGFTQLFRNGEIWGVTRELVATHQGEFVVPMVNVKNLYERTLTNFVSIASTDLNIPPAYQIELGAVGLKDTRVSLPRELMQWPNQLSDPIYENQLQLRRILNDMSAAAVSALVGEFVRKLYDLAAIQV